MEKTRLPCFQCNEIFSLGDFYEIKCDGYSSHCVCSKECKDKLLESRSNLQEEVVERNQS